MRKMWLWIGLAMIVLSITACSQENSSTAVAATTPAASRKVSVEVISAEQTVALLHGKTLCGITRPISAAEDEKKYEAYFKEHFDLNLDLAGELYATNISEALQMLRNQKAEAFEVLGATAYYVVQQNSDLKLYIQEFKPSTVHLLFNKDKTAAFEKVDNAIREMAGDGTLIDLKKRWIEQTAELTAAVFSKYEGSETIRVGYTGEEPPLDYTAVSGEPTGYAAAVLAEISQRRQLNVEMVKIKTSDRFAALQSGAIDAFLWKTEMGTAADYPAGKVYDDIDPAVYNIVFSYPYLETNRGLLVLKK